MQNIEENCFGTDLKHCLFELKEKTPDSKEIEAFIKLCQQSLEDIRLNNFSEEFLDNFSEIDKYKNKEILARWREYLSNRFRNERKVHLKKAVFLYLEIYSLTNNIKYLKHSLHQVKMAKALFSKELDRIYDQGKKAVQDLEKPFRQQELLIELASINPEKVKQDFNVFLRKSIEKHTSMNDFSGVLTLIESLKVIGIIGNNDQKTMLAENYEKDGDYQTKNKKPKTFYPNILITYQKGLRELKSIECDSDLRERLEKKVLNEQKENIRMHSAIANSYINEGYSIEKIVNDFGDRCIYNLEIKDFQSGFSNLLSFPLSLDKYINRDSGDKHFLSQFISKYQRIDSKGKVVGETTRDEYELIRSRGIWREFIINFLKKTKWTMDEDNIPNEEIVFYYLFKKCKSNFIPSDRKWIFAKGISAGFSNDFITAAHILVPQIENSLKYMMEQNGLVTARIYEDIQHDNMLGGLLDKLIETNGHDLFYELKDFLIENSSVNFRNELCHGLLTPIQIDHYGIYIWWLCLRMIYDKGDIFEIKI